jgi:hypothetical protein
MSRGVRGSSFQVVVAACLACAGVGTLRHSTGRLNVMARWILQANPSVFRIFGALSDVGAVRT